MTLRVEKAVVYTGVQTPFVPALKVQKANVYVAVLVPSTDQLKVEKAAVYAGVQVQVHGDAYQTTSGNRPIYKAGPKPWIDFSTGQSLIAYLATSSSHAAFCLDRFGNFSQVFQDTLPTGYHTFSTDFNQYVVIDDPAPTTYKKNLYKANMLKRYL